MPITLEQFVHSSLHLPKFSIQQGEAWCIHGSNNSGASTLLQLLTGKLNNFSTNQLQIPKEITCLTTHRQQEIFEQELANDDSDFLNRPDPGTPARDFLPAWEKRLEVVQALDMVHCLETGYRQLSSGQSRKLLFLMGIFSSAKYLVLENPFDGLDTNSCGKMENVLQQELATGRTLLLFVTNHNDIPTWCSHLALIHQGKLLFQGEMPEDNRRATLLASMRESRAEQQDFKFPTREKQEELIFLQNGFAGYNGKQLFSGVNLNVKSGEHTLITGCNGCGKSTLFDIITGDNSKCYSNDLRLFGRKRGSGESIWEIKSRMGIVSPSLHREHHGVGTALQVVLSGLFDSIGLYKQATPAENAKAQKWLRWAGLAESSKRPFSHLNYGKQRLILIARALVKEPELLMLDEPTQGLDQEDRAQLLDFLERVTQQNGTTIFYISHRQDEYRSFFHQRVCLEDYQSTSEKP